MPAPDHLHPGQLGMFYPAHQLKERAGFLDADLGDTTATERTTGGSTNRGWGGSGPRYVERQETHEEGWEQKANEASDYGLTHSIETEGGVHRPVALAVNDPYGGWGSSEPVEHGSMQMKDWAVYNGHHRIAAALEVDPQMEVPTLHYKAKGAPRGAGHPGMNVERYGPLGEQFGHSGPIRERQGPDPERYVAISFDHRPGKRPS